MIRKVLLTVRELVKIAVALGRNALRELVVSPAPPPKRKCRKRFIREGQRRICDLDLEHEGQCEVVLR